MGEESIGNNIKNHGMTPVRFLGQRTLAFLKSGWTTAITLLTGIGIIVGVWYSPLFVKPKISISSGTIPVMLPARTQTDFMMLKMMFMKKELAKACADHLMAYLKEFGMPKEKLTQINKLFTKQLASEGELNIGKNSVELNSEEEKILVAAGAKAMTDCMTNLGEKFNFPDTIVFFQIMNTGRADAEDVHITIKMGGTYFESRIDSTNEYTSKAEGRNFKVDLKSVSPGAKIQGIVWWDKQEEKSIFESNKISVVYKGGMKDSELKENSFFINQ